MIIESNLAETLISLDELNAMKPSIGEDGVKTFYFDHSVFHPPGSFGLISLEKTYRKIFPQEGGADVDVGVGVVGVSAVDSLKELVGLKIFIQLEWEDNRIQWGLEGLEGPRVDEQWEFNTRVLE